MGAPWHAFLGKNLQVQGPISFHALATDSYEASNIYQIFHDNSSGEACFLFE